MLVCTSTSPFAVPNAPIAISARSPHREDAHARYIEALLCEVESQKKLWAQFHYDTLYIGGGTPTNLDTALLVQLLTTLLSGIQPDEITIEANPGTVDEKQSSCLTASRCESAQPRCAEHER